ncbi:hypothetical protein J3F84DRAFT_154722 [Trichoderma pleuroticola]
MGRCTIQEGTRVVISRIGVGAKSRTTHRGRVSPAGVLLEVKYRPFSSFSSVFHEAHRLASDGRSVFFANTAFHYRAYMGREIVSRSSPFLLPFVLGLLHYIKTGEMSPRECHDILRPVLEWAGNSVSCMHGGFHAIFLFLFSFPFVCASTGEAWKFVEKRKLGKFVF